ncbi:MAG: CotH kinase family protein [Acutalibacteraceae bacterium]
MSTHKWIDRICILAVVLALVITVAFMNGESLGIQSATRAMAYESKIFDTSRVHTLDIVIDDWDEFIDGCEDEEYVPCTVVIDNESFKNVGIRAKGNTSLRNVSSMDSSRYSFKIEFDHYTDGKTYHGLDKLSLNNIIQDNTYMKDYLTYRLMAQNGVCAPLCSFVYITVNGEDWGLYLAVEGVEDAFLQRNYGNDTGELYKPDSESFGGGRGNGQDFDMNAFNEEAEEGVSMPDKADFPRGEGFPADEQFQPPELPQGDFPDGENSFDGEKIRNGEKGMPGEMGRGSSDVMLQYTDDDPDSYANIFDNAKTDISEKDKTRLIESLRLLSAQEDLEQALDIEQVLRYFVVHNYVVNGDSYTGSMIHNYYLHEKDGQLSMIPWDYNLAFGSFQGNSASSAVNDPIDTPLSVSGNGDRPMADWIFSGEEYTDAYHKLFAEFLENTDIDGIIRGTHDLIAPYVEKDPTKFCTAEEFEKGVSALRTFCDLRTQSVLGQLNGTIPSTDDGQQADNSACIETGELNISDMGTMGMGGGNGFRGGKGQNGTETAEQPTAPAQDGEVSPPSAQEEPATTPSGEEQPFAPAEGEQPPRMPNSGETPPDKPDFGNGTPPNGFAGGMRPDFGGASENESA